MKTTIIFLMIWVTISCADRKGYNIQNNSDSDIVQLTRVVSRSEVNQYLIDTTGDRQVIVKTMEGTILVSQCDDLDADGKWDELAFFCDVKAHGKLKVYFETSDSIPYFEKKTNIRFGKMTKPFEEITDTLRMKTNETRFTEPVFQMEGPAWENDWIAFRNYYDARNGIDIFGKTSSDLVLDSVGLNGRDYHTLASWGMDILKVGNSLGAGAIAIAIGDSLYRIGPCNEGHYRLITEGPVRLILELNYRNVPAGDRFYDVVHRISMSAGDRFYRSQVWVDKLQGDEELVTGIVNLHDVPADSFSQGPVKMIYSLGNQGFSGELLGMALLVPAVDFKSIREAPVTGSHIVSTHLAYLKIKPEEPAEFAFLASWQNREKEISDPAFFKSVLMDAADKIAAEK